MSDAAPLLLELPCPAANDRDLSELLDEILAATGACWVELRLIVEGSSIQRRFRRGTGSGDGVEVTLPLPRSGIAATLTLGAHRAPAEGTLRLIGIALEQTLLARRLFAQASLLRSALDTTSAAVLLFDGSGAIIYANPKGDTLLSEQTEQVLLVAPRRGRPTPLISHVCRTIEELVASDADDDPGSRETLTLSDGSIVVCELLRVRVDDDDSTGVLVLLQRIEGSGSPRIEAIAAAHDLSPRETDVTRLLLEGHATAAIAERLGISSHTVRDHLKRLYRKTETRSRSELVCRLTAAPELHPAAPRG